MNTLRRIATGALVVTYLHLVFGGIVRITGSGMGCGDHWPRCNGSWIPPFDNPPVMIEYTHRLLALLVILSISWLAIAAYRRRGEPGVAGPGGVLRPAVTALCLVVAVALLGMVTVKLGNRPSATIAHWTLAMALLAVVAMAAVNAGGLGGAAALAQGGTSRAARSLGAGAALAFITVVMGGLVAKYPGASFACPSFPLCGATPTGIPPGAAHIQLTHRGLAYVLFLHVLGVTTAVTRRRTEAAVVKGAASFATGLVLFQLALGAAMVLSALPPVLRSAHQAVGIGVWLALFVATYLARTAAKERVR
ncbi:MAG TPA: COX15/CtaA family protein [Gemmatimonadaceae bacterium]|nr:COX15/CtaA family protein [Gemmatimonadaceae bacterium]